ncbi:MAG: PLP-dependent aminotransferase family protein [Synergistaceae bacterium]|jgi:2-aminoadipate transaminase|nr:PLP-dependent aminotransferase family protein [Synergistaceae bacterium]
MTEFAKRVRGVSGDAIREIFAMMADRELLSFGGGSPAKETFPVDEIRAIIDSALSRNPDGLLQYGMTDGWMPLREAYLEHLVRGKGVRADIENVITLTGSTQGMSIVAEAFLDPGDKVLVESPTFLGTLMGLRKLGADCIPVKGDDRGIVIEDLEDKMKRHRPKILYVIPTFQNPTGLTIPEDRRKEIARLAGVYDVIVIEDDPYCELRYSGTPVPPIKSFDGSGHVVMVNSFSKTISPGIRVGAMTADANIIRKASDIRQLADTHGVNLTQEICAEFLNRGHMPGHLKKITPIYEERLAAMLGGISAHFPEECRFTRPEGGLFVWVELPRGTDSAQLLKRSVAEMKVGFIPGGPFFVNPEDGANCFRLNFSSNPPDRIADGMERLGSFLKKAI